MSVSAIVSIVIFAAFIQSTLGLRIMAHPQRFTEESSGTVQISCMPDLADHCEEKDIIVLEIGKEGEKPMAFVRQRTGVSYGSAIAHSYEATGQLDNDNGNAFNTFLNVSLSNPKNTDTGTFFCTMYYFDVSGAFTEQTVTTNITVEIFDIHTIVRRLMKRVDELEEEDQKSKTRIAELEDESSKVFDIHTIVTPLMMRVEELEEEDDKSKKRFAELEDDCSKVSHEITALEHLAQNHTLEMHHMVDRVSHEMTNWGNRTTVLELLAQNHTLEMHDMVDRAFYMVAFTAALKEVVRPSAGDVLVFPDVRYNQGNGYDPTTGVFTAPRAGVYVFNLVLKTITNYSTGQAYIGYTGQGMPYITVNGHLIARLYVDKAGPSRDEQSSVSVVIPLKVGDEVKAVAGNTMNWDGNNYSMFTGYIIQAF